MTTEGRPLYLVITDPTLTLDYLNKNSRIILHTKIIWELRKSTRQIIRCHNCHAWGHAIFNCGRPPRYLKCAGGYLTRTYTKPQDVSAICANCKGDHPDNFSKYKYDVKRIERLEEGKVKNQISKYKPASQPTSNY